MAERVEGLAVDVVVDAEQATRELQKFGGALKTTATEASAGDQAIARIKKQFADLQAELKGTNEVLAGGGRWNLNSALESSLQLMNPWTAGIGIAAGVVSTLAGAVASCTSEFLKSKEGFLAGGLERDAAVESFRQLRLEIGKIAAGLLQLPALFANVSWALQKITQSIESSRPALELLRFIIPYLGTWENINSFVTLARKADQEGEAFPDYTNLLMPGHVIGGGSYVKPKAPRAPRKGRAPRGESFAFMNNYGPRAPQPGFDIEYFGESVLTRGSFGGGAGAPGYTLLDQIGQVNKIDELNDLFREGRIGLDDYVSGLEKIRDTVQKTFGEDSDQFRAIQSQIDQYKALTTHQELMKAAVEQTAQAIAQMAAASIMAALAGGSWKKAINEVAKSMMQMNLAQAVEALALGIMASTPWGAALLGPPAPYFEAAAVFGTAAAAWGVLAAASGGFKSSKEGSSGSKGGSAAKESATTAPVSASAPAPQINIYVEGSLVTEDELARILTDAQRRQSGRVGVA